MINITYVRGDYEPYELAYYRESDRADRAERKIIHLEEERDIVEEQLQNWQQLYEQIKPKGRDEMAQVCWCDLCENIKLNDDAICFTCTMRSNFTYDEVTFGEIKDA